MHYCSHVSAYTMLICTLIAACPTFAAAPTEGDIKLLLAKMPAEHRVLWPQGGEGELRRAMAADPELSFVWDQIRAAADAMLPEAPVERKLIGRRLLDKSRTALSRTLNLGMAYRMTGERKYADRAIAEMLAASAFEDWNPSHFLDVGEMTAAMAIGLDWCGDAVTDDQKASVRTAIVEKGLRQSLAKEYGWIKGDNNWNQVCNSGLILGALAVGREEPDVAARVIARAVDGLPHAMKQFAPDGAYPEGPGYWGYGTTFNVMGISALQAALGSDFGLLRQPGYLATGNYYLHLSGPAGLYFNYSDCGQRKNPSPSPAMFYFARETHDDTLVFSERQWIRQRMTAAEGGKKIGGWDRLNPLLLVWASPSKDQTPAATHYVGNGVTPVAAFRTGWDRDATYLAIKAGGASASHAHMDAGTFVIDALGERWADDLGMQEYESLESKKVDLWNMKQDSQRWRVFRIGPMAHNVLTVDDKLHVVAGKSTFVKTTNDRAVVDLSPVYAGQLASARRGARLGSDGSVTLRDEVTAGGTPATVRFAFVTRSDVKLIADGAALSHGEKRMAVKVSGVEGLVMETYSTVGPETYDAVNPGTHLVGFKVKLGPGQSAAWDVNFVPQGKASESTSRPLKEW